MQAGTHSADTAIRATFAVVAAVERAAANDYQRFAQAGAHSADTHSADAHSADAEIRAAFAEVERAAANNYLRFAQAFVNLVRIARRRGARVIFDEIVVENRDLSKSGSLYIKVLRPGAAEPIADAHLRGDSFGAHRSILEHGGVSSPRYTIWSDPATGYERVSVMY